MRYKGGFGMEPVRIDSFCQFHFVSNPGFSPDGRYIAFVVRQADLKSNSYPGNLYFYDTEKDSYSQLTTSGKVTSYIWLDENPCYIQRGKQKKAAARPFIIRFLWMVARRFRFLRFR